MDVREKLLGLIAKAKYICANDYSDHTEDEYIADTLLDNGVTVQEWISVKDRLPDKPMKCLVYTKRGDCGGYEITYYNKGFYLQYSNVTHWMPLPTAPKGE